MRLIKAIAEVRYKDIPPGDDFNKKLQTFVKTISTSPFPITNLNSTSAVQLGDANTKTIKLISPNKSGIDKFFPESEEEAVTTLVNFLRQVNEVVSIRSITRIGVRGLWIKETSMSMATLVNTYKKKFFKENQLVSSAVDVAISFTIKDERSLVNFNSGPVLKQQLIDLFFNPNPTTNIDIPEKLVLVDYDNFLSKSQNFNTQMIKEFTNNALTKGRQAAEDIANILEI